MFSPKGQSVQFVVAMRAANGSDRFLSPNGVWFPEFDRAMRFERITDAFAACRESREPGCRVGVTCEGELLPGWVIAPSQVPARG